jgi:hypothetical protein
MQASVAPAASSSADLRERLTVLWLLDPDMLVPFVCIFSSLRLVPGATVVKSLFAPPPFATDQIEK